MQSGGCNGAAVIYFIKRAAAFDAAALFGLLSRINYFDDVFLRRMRAVAHAAAAVISTVADPKSSIFAGSDVAVLPPVPPATANMVYSAILFFGRL